MCYEMFAFNLPAAFNLNYGDFMIHEQLPWTNDFISSRNTQVKEYWISKLGVKMVKWVSRFIKLIQNHTINLYKLL